MPFGTGGLTSSAESVVALFKGGRLQTWHTLTDAQQDDYSAQHVELMLGVAHEHGMMTLEGFKLHGAEAALGALLGARVPRP